MPWLRFAAAVCLIVPGYSTAGASLSCARRRRLHFDIPGVVARIASICGFGSCTAFNRARRNCSRIPALNPRMVRFKLVIKKTGTDSILGKFRGAYATNCWRPNRNMRAWYSLRLNSTRSVLFSKGYKSNDESPLSQQGMPSCANSRSWKHHPPRLLQDYLGKSPSIPL
jgi:hypothetical protein